MQATASEILQHAATPSLDHCTVQKRKPVHLLNSNTAKAAHALPPASFQNQPATAEL
jgi:hypothetical protein